MYIKDSFMNNTYEEEYSCEIIYAHRTCVNCDGELEWINHEFGVKYCGNYHPKIGYVCDLCVKNHCIKRRKCRYCNLMFKSGNLMFKHIRNANHFLDEKNRYINIVFAISSHDIP